MMIEDMNRRPNKQNLASSVKHLLESLGFSNVWIFQGVGLLNISCQNSNRECLIIFFKNGMQE